MTIPADDAPVVDDAADSRYVLQESGAEAELVYVIDGDRMILVHTGVPDEWGGHGIGGAPGPCGAGAGRRQRADRRAAVSIRPALAGGPPRRGGWRHGRLDDATSAVVTSPCMRNCQGVVLFIVYGT